MNRRKFVATAGATSVAAVFPQTSDANKETQSASFFELRKYISRVGSHRGRLASFLKDVAIPAWNRAGISNVGAFNVVHGPTDPTTYVLLTHDSLMSMNSLRGKLVDDAAYQADGKAFLSATLDDPGYTRVESSLFKGFDAMPNLAVPAGAADNAQRIFELRIYESHSEEAAIRKIHMFNNGEIPIFLDTGLTPVFFGEAMVGERLPNLTYMLTFKDLAARSEAWGKFVVHPDWEKMKADTYYKDTVSNITSIILRPLPFSQV
ncbi:MAG: NIPSNAP family protein [Bacteroidota bacterium]